MTYFLNMKTSTITLLTIAIAVAALITSIYSTVSADFYTIQFLLLVAIQCLGIYALINLKNEARRRENKTSNNNEVSQ